MLRCVVIEMPKNKKCYCLLYVLYFYIAFIDPVFVVYVWLLTHFTLSYVNFHKYIQTVGPAVEHLSESSPT